MAATSEVSHAAFARERERLVAETAQELAAVAARLHTLNTQLGALADRRRALDDVATLWTSFHARVVAHHTAASEAVAAATTTNNNTNFPAATAPATRPPFS
jgi:hypothetical protein